VVRDAGAAAGAEAGGEILVGRRWRLTRPGQVPGADGRIGVVLTPGAFGSGEHETTRSCLELLEGLDGVRGARVLDLGCGTGVLAIAALKLGAASAVGVDDDPRAAATARRNGDLNAVVDRLVLLAGTLAAVGEASFDLVLANLYADVLLAAAEELVARCRPGAALILSGILWEHNLAVRERYGALGCGVTANRFLAEYSSMVLVRDAAG
jgi:ribosomal protein L11 methyltransferase